MARVVKVSLQAEVAQFKAGMTEAERAAKKLGDAVDGIDGTTLDTTAGKAKELGDATGVAAAKAKQNFEVLAQQTKKLDGQIRETETSIKSLAREFAKTGDSGTLKAIGQQQQQLRELTKVRNLLPTPEEFEKAGRGAGGNIIDGIRSAMSGASPGSLGFGIVGVLLAPTIGAAIAGAVVGGAGIGGVIGGVMLAARNEQVKTAGQTLGRTLLADLQQRAGGFVEPVMQAMAQIRVGFASLGPDLDRIFGSSRFVQPLTDGLVQATKGFVSGFADAVDAADPVIGALRGSLISIGTATGDVFREMAGDAKEGASSINDMTLAVTSLISVTSHVADAAAKTKGFSDQVDKVIDRGRYWFEDNSAIGKSLKDVGLHLDLTADGFKVGSVQAEAYRKATLGTATATDFAILKQAKMSDTQIAAADASGTYQAQIAKVAEESRAAAMAAGLLVASDDDVKAASQQATLAQQDFTHTLEQINPAASKASQIVDGLKKATQSLYGAQIASTDANEAYAASWDSLTDSVKQNKTSLDLHTRAGRSNRDALEDLLSKNNDLYTSDIAAGVATDVARKKHEQRTEAVRKEAIRLHLNKQATEELIGTYGQIPGKKTTDLVIDGVQKVVDQLYNLYVLQRSLADGIPVDSEKAKLEQKAGPKTRFGGYAAGGQFDGRLPGPASNVDNLTGIGPQGQVFGLAGGEYIVKASQARKHLPVLQAINSGADGYASGGLFPPVDTSRSWPFEIDAGNSKVMSKAQAASRIAVATGNSGAGPGGGQTYKWIEQVVHAAFPGMKALSTFRPGAVTLTGHRSYHAVGRAVDWPASKPLAEWVNANYFARTRELITPWNSLNIWNGKRHTYTGDVFAQHAGTGRFKGNAHDHWAMFNGGVITEPVVGVGASGRTYSFAERGPERVLPGYASGGLVNFAPAAASSTSSAGSKLATAEAMISAAGAVTSLTSALKENGRSWSTATQKGRDNRSALIAGIRAAQDAAKAKFDETGSVKASNKVYADYVKQLDAAMRSMKINAATRRSLIKAYSEQPKYDTTAVAPSNSSNLIKATTDHMAIEDALGTAQQSFTWTKPTFNLKTTTGRAELNSLFSFLSAAEQGAQSMYDYMGDPKQAMSYYNGYIADLRSTLIKSGMKAADVDALLKRYGRITLQPKANRWGGVYEHAAAGVLKDAQIAGGGPTQYAWAEPSTGGELFAPKNGNIAKTRSEVGWAVSNWWGGQVNWSPGTSGSQPAGRTVVVDATIPITLGADTITRQVRIEVDAALGQVASATVYQAA